MNCKKKLKMARRLLGENLLLTQGEIGGKMGLSRTALLRVLMELCDEELYQFNNPLQKKNTKFDEKMIPKVKYYLEKADKILQDENYQIKNKEIVENSLRLVEEIVCSYDKKQKQKMVSFDYGNVINNLLFEINNIAIFKMVYKKHKKEFNYYLQSPEIFSEFVEKFFDQIRTNADAAYLMNIAKMLGFIVNETNSPQNEKVLDTYKSQLKAKKHNRGCKKELKKYLNIIKKSINHNINPEALHYLANYYGIAREFNCDVNGAMIKNDQRNYVDLTKKHVITMDGSKTGCLEDAISIEEQPNGNYLFNLYVINPFAYVKEGSDVIEEASNRAQSIYANGVVIPMFPEKLTYNELSLIKNENKKVIVSSYEFSSAFDLIAHTSYPAIIHVKENYDFNEIDNINEAKMTEVVTRLIKLKENLKKEYTVLNDNNSQQDKKLFADELIGCIKVFCNHSMTEKYRQQQLPFIYCVDNGVNQVVNDLQRENPFLNLKSEIKKSKTFYSTNNIGHRGLNLNCYARVTTPVRNYAALKNQSLYQKALIEEREYSDQEIYLLEEELNNVAKHMNKKQDDIQAFMEENNNNYYQKVKKLGY